MQKIISLDAMVGLSSQFKVKKMLGDLINVEENVMLVGPAGSGKSMIAREVLHNLKGSKVVAVECNATTSASDLIRKLQTNSIAINGKIWRPKDGSRFILYIKNLNLIKPDQYETIGLVEFLLQILTYKGFYDENLEFVQLEKVQMVVTMQNPRNRGRSQVSTRFTSRMRVLILDPLSGQEATEMYSSLIVKVIESKTCKNKDFVHSSSKILGKCH